MRLFYGSKYYECIFEVLKIYHIKVKIHSFDVNNIDYCNVRKSVVFDKIELLIFIKLYDTIVRREIVHRNNISTLITLYLCNVFLVYRLD